MELGDTVGIITVRIDYKYTYLLNILLINKDSHEYKLLWLIYSRVDYIINNLYDSNWNMNLKVFAVTELIINIIIFKQWLKQQELYSFIQYFDRKQLN